MLFKEIKVDRKGIITNTIISAARKAATANTFVICDFSDITDQFLKKKKLGHEQLWNCDE